MSNNISTVMLIFFILFFIISVWKIYVFLPNKELEDDDRNDVAQNELKLLIFKIIRQHNGELTPKELFIKLTQESHFDKKHFWRFNQNRLNQLLQQYYKEYENTYSIRDLYEKI